MRSTLSICVLLLLICGTAPCAAFAATDAALNGVVRDTHGTPQMGALVELIGPHAMTVSRAITDDHGRYALRDLLPGVYELRVTAAFLLPTMRDHVQLRAGTQAVANLTMTALFEASSWLPTEARNTGRSSDDWRWALRSSGNRPLLRLGNQAPPVVARDAASSSSLEHPVATKASGQLLVSTGDGTFGEGGTRQTLTLDREDAGGEVSAFRANVADGLPGEQSASGTVAAGLERKSPWGGGTRVFVSFSSYPQLQTPAATGVQVWHMATTETIDLGDAVMVDAGTLFTAERMLGDRFTSAPYLRATLKPTPALALEYRMATDRNLQSSSDLDDMALHEDTLTDAEGRPLLRNGLHQELAATYTQAGSTVAMAVFGDHLPVEELQGSGLVSGQSLSGKAAMADPGTGTLRLAAGGYETAGIRVAWNQTFTPALEACVEAEVGSALTAQPAQLALADLSAQVRSQAAAALSGSLRLHNQRHGSTVDLRYRWQKQGTLTAVDEFDTAPDEGYLGVSFRQRLWSGQRLQGLNAVVEATNLLAQGYIPVLAPDGQTLFLAQAPRSLQGGLAFRF